jgi:hypothetical protein
MQDQSSFWGTIATIVMWVGMSAMSVLFMLLMRPDALGAAIFLLIMAGIGVGGSAVIWDNIVKLRKIALDAARRSADSRCRRRPSPSAARCRQSRPPA